MSAADALLATADQMAVTIQEYHEEVKAYDDSRESEVVSAFVARVQAAPDDSDVVWSLPFRQDIFTDAPPVVDDEP